LQVGKTYNQKYLTGQILNSFSASVA
jgi:hypothetical protein